MSNTNRPPLWQVMRDAYEKGSGTIIVLGEEVLPGPAQSEFAAMLRAIADWLVPEETARAWTGPGMERQSERLHLRQTLLAEADRAEAGDASD